MANYSKIQSYSEKFIKTLNKSVASVNKLLDSLNESNWKNNADVKSIIKLIQCGSYIRCVYPVGKDSSAYWLGLVEKTKKVASLKDLKAIWAEAAEVRK